MRDPFRAFLPKIDRTRPPAAGAADRRLSFSTPLDTISPPAARMIGRWRPLLAEPYRGITTDGVVKSGLFATQPQGAPTEAALAAVRHWLGLLSPEQEQTVRFAVDARDWRLWNNTPHIFAETQIELRDMTAVQRDAAFDVLRASLSSRGFDLVRDLVVLNGVVGPLFGLPGFLTAGDYALGIFGEPAMTGPWGWQFYGHHVCLNCFFLGTQMVLSPSFLGAEPSWVDEGPHAGMSFFEDHERLGLALMRSLGAALQHQATLYRSMRTEDQPPDRYDPDDGRAVGGAFQDNRIVPYEGAPIAAFSPGQRAALMDLVETHIAALPDGPRRARLAEIACHLDESYFAWIGGTGAEAVFYYRIHGPVVLIEFDHHKGIFLTNDQPQRTHIHVQMRTPNGNDYGFALRKT